MSDPAPPRTLMLKDRLTRLGQAVRNAVQHARLRDDQQRSIEALRASEEHYRSLFEEAPHPMWVVEAETLRFLEVNHKAVSHYGYSRDEFLAMTLHDIRPPEDVPEMLDGVQAVFAGERRRGRRRHRTKDGGLLEVSVASRVTSFAGRRALIAVVDDVTERHRLELQLRQVQKMDAVGQLAGGIAHDFNNLLNAILGYSGLVADELTDRPELLAQVEEIIKAGERGAALTRQLLAFSRKQNLRPRLVNLSSSVAGVEAMLRRLIGEHVELSTRLPQNGSQVLVDPGQIEQVIVNLAVNARDAMPKGGQLIIETADVELDEVYAATHAGVRPGAYVLLAVSDDGCGMDAATRARIFEPFFTTKEQGKGTGLGLATVYGIVHQSGGCIEVYSEPGHGTSFKIYLPRAAGSAAGSAEEAARPARPRGGSETVLVLEDDTALRRLVGTLLARAGYKVLAEDTATAAIAAAATYAGRIDLVLTDVVMPTMNGPEVAARLAAVRPEARLLYMSGYTGDIMGRSGLVPPGAALLEKPFTERSLLLRVRELLDGPEAGCRHADPDGAAMTAPH